MIDPESEATARLTRYVLDTPAAAIPANVTQEGIRSLVNIVGCTLGGADHDAVERAWSATKPFAGAGHATLMGRSEMSDALTAAFINTLSSSINTFDDTHAEAIVHPSGPVMAGVLAVAELRSVSGAEALAAFTLGVDVICRLSKAISVAPAKGDIAWSQTGVTCGIGTALAAARLMRLDADKAAMAVGIAAANASGIRALHGTMSTAGLPAFAGQAGLRAALLADAGFTASKTVIEARYGFAGCFAEEVHMPYLIDGLGSQFEILGNTYKPYPCGIVIHPLIDAALEIAAERKTTADKVKSVSISANPTAMALCFRRHPKDEMEGQVSLYQWVAAALARGKAGIAEGTEAAIAEPAIRALRDRIEVTTDPTIPHDGGDMTVTLADGSTATRSIRNCIGSRKNPMTDAQLDAKFRAAAAGKLSEGAADVLLAKCRGLASLGDAAEIARGAHRA